MLLWICTSMSLLPINFFVLFCPLFQYRMFNPTMSVPAPVIAYFHLSVDLLLTRTPPPPPPPHPLQRRRGRSMDEGRHRFILYHAAHRCDRSMDMGHDILYHATRRRDRSMDEGGPSQWMPSSRSHRRRSAMDRGHDTPLDRGLAQLQTV
jgi:hypothetical protein